jgi:hypothetical protein
MGRPLAKLTFCKAMLAARCVEHQIEAAAIDTLGGHLHPGSAGEFYQSARAHAHDWKNSARDDRREGAGLYCGGGLGGLTGQQKNSAGYQWFESISVQRRVSCELDRLRQSASLRATRPHRRQPYWHAQDNYPAHSGSGSV